MILANIISDIDTDTSWWKYRRYRYFCKHLAKVIGDTFTDTFLLL